MNPLEPAGSDEDLEPCMKLRGRDVGGGAGLVAGVLMASGLAASIAAPGAMAQTVPAVTIMRAMPMPADPAAAATEPEPNAGAAPIAEGEAAMSGPPTPGAPEAGGPPTAEEIAELKTQYEALTEPEQVEMRAYYADMGVDLDQLLGLAAARSAQASKGQQITQAMRELEFVREPQAVLAARARLGFGQVPYPNPETAPPEDIAKWIHLHTMAGEWGTLATYLRSRPLPEAEAIYTFVMQAMGRGDPGLLPEEVLAFAEASPGDFKPWQITTLGKLLAAASKKNSPAPMLAQIRAGTRLFGPMDAASRRRTIDFLAGGGLVKEAYEFLPTLEEARASADGELLLVHARYKEALAEAAVEGPEREALSQEAWAIACEVALLPRATFETRREGLKRAIEGMANVPSARVRPWLTEVFASDTIGPVALEIMALTAASIGDSKLGVEQRAQAVLTLKEGVDILLARDGVDSSALRVPLRMLTTALVAEMEATVAEKGQQRTVAREAQLLLRAVPSERWLAALEPSLATRARKASIGIATLADETDMAISLLEAAIKKNPEQAAELANHFLVGWEQRLNPQADSDDQNFPFYFFYREFMPAAPLTRGRQRRNLDRLDRLMDTLSAIGVEPRSLPAIVPTFKACHAKTEVYDKDDLARVFGPLDKIPASTAAGLAQTMGASLNGDWRSRTVQRSTGTKRSDSEIALLVDKGYGLALELADSAVSSQPDDWKLSVLRAALAYDRMQFNQSQGKGEQDPAKQNELRRAAFEAFAQAAARYSGAIATGQERDDPTIYRRWFGAAMGTAELNFLRPDDLPKEGTLQDDQIDLIRNSMRTLPAEALDRHLAVFAAEIQDAVERAEPEVKPRLVRHALRIIGDHPAGASLRSMEELYQDLIKDEIKLRVTLDGEDRVGVGQPFAALVSLRFTNSVDRETGGFSKYLQNNVFGLVGNSYREINYRDQLQKSLENSLGKGFDVDAIGFFDPFMPPRGVVEDGQDGWLEKPMAYVILTRKDASVDRLPQIVLDMQFNDQTGPVTLALPSNTPLLAVTPDRAPRPVKDLTVAQIVDVRAITEGDQDGKVTLEVQARGSGVLPDISEILAGIESAMPGFTVAEGGIERRPPIILQEGDVATGRFGWNSGGDDEPKDGYPEPDANGMYRLKVERGYTVTYTPSGGPIGGAFKVPALREGVQAALESRYYSDLDIVPVQGTTVAVTRPFWTPMTITITAMFASIVALLAWLLRRRSPDEPAPASSALTPARMTPLGVVTSLRRYRNLHAATLDQPRREALDREIGELELKYFGPAATGAQEDDLRPIVQRWASSSSR
jgi:hypothetical protein